ncbi:MAPEG family protein [Rhizomicrobium electricum]|uniref:MAPEG family protein n=1 Tax=Rhizomicrobium electricum TaxID=480070 RepID=A0ABN1EPS0_9PROT|nr:MAPEG family protein [Rhizomicrobium electricum]NIJ48848.1 glutathione S-transferase [Rhizomicrobium electricum]
MQASPAVLSTALVTILALVVYFYMGVRVGQMRVKHGIKAPATSGHPEFDRAFRVQMNTLEHLPVLIPLLWLTVFYFYVFPMAAPALGVVWVLGRVVYMNGYMKDPEKRGPGFGLSALAEVLLLVLALFGIVAAFFNVA